MSTKPTDQFQLIRLLSDLHEANAAHLLALTAIIEYQDARITRIEQLLSAPTPARLSN